MQILKMAHLKRGFFFITACLTLLLSGWQISKSRSFQFAGEIVNRVETRKKLVALTFDDGPTKGYTENVLDTLETQGIRGTFFLVGSEMSRHPELTELIVKSGHEVGNH
ncbi:MAG: polysaccharide deacetylase family protein, partial [bacterium]